MTELGRLREEGLARAIGVSNVSLDQLQIASQACPVSACQLPYNMLQREIELDIVPWCRDQGVAIVAYWPLMKGLLAGGMPRDRIFPATDSRHKYPMFNGTEFQRNLDFVEVVRGEAQRLGRPLPDLVLAWTAKQPGITSVLFGATSPEQVRMNAAAGSCEIDPQANQAIATGIISRGTVMGRRPV
jgi:aryl-alcohol dehydrogenase-like predicted oxidoreductase